MSSVVLATYQSRLVDALAAEITSSDPAACVLLAPTGAGKTLILGRAISAAGMSGDMPPTIWFWVAPYEVIVSQTEGSLRAQVGPMAHPRDLSTGRTITSHMPGDVWMTTTAYLVNPKSGLQEDTERAPSLATLVASIRAEGFRVGLIVDEAHIAADSATRFGQVVRAIAPDVVIAATATPKDERLDRFLASIGQTRRRDFSVNRADVVRSHLNKEALRVLRLVSDKERATVDQETLLDLLVERAWSRNQEIAVALERNSVGIVPLMLVQIGNGSDEGSSMKARIRRICGLADKEIALYLDDEQSHGKLTAIANNPSVKALVFKVAAGTGFDVPRAFVLASARPANSGDAALQFIGRIMRVPREIRAMLYAGALPPEDRAILHAGRLVVIDEASQAGFRKAADLIKSMRQDIDPDVQDVSIDDEFIVGGLNEGEADSNGATSRMIAPSADDSSAGAETDSWEDGPQGEQARMKSGTDTPAAPCGRRSRSADSCPASPASTDRNRTGPMHECYIGFEALRADLNAQGLEAYRLDPAIPTRLSRECWPDISASGGMVTKLASAIQPDLNAIDRLLPAAIGERRIQMKDSDFLGGGKAFAETVRIESREFAAEHARMLAKATLDRLPGMSDQGARKSLLSLVAADVQRRGRKILPDASAARSVASLLIAEQEHTLVQAHAREMISRAYSEPAEALPDILIAPIGFGEAAAKSAYGLIPGDGGNFEEIDPETRKALKAWRTTVRIGEPGKTRILELAPVDHDWTVNETEKAFIDLLERHEFVSWWMRNPARKPYAVAILKADGRRGLFYPDFVLGTAWDGRPRQQLAETKYDPNDLEAKMLRGVTVDYGRVMFIRLLNDRLHVVENDGRIGPVLSVDSIDELTEQMRRAILA